MSKIAKLLRSALNNSNANEAAQALKMAGSAMQKEGVNPSSLLNMKVDNSAEIERLQIEIDALKRDGISHAELREAKELAIKWHNVAEQLQQESREIAKAAVTAQALADENAYRLNKFRDRTWIGAIIAGFAMLAIWGVTLDSGKGRDYRNGFNAGFKAAKTYTPEPEVKQTLEPVPVPEPAPQVAVCYGTYTNGVKLRFTYDHRILKAYARKNNRGKWIDISESIKKEASNIPLNYDANQFIQQMKEDAKQEKVKVQCKIGKLI